MFYNNRSQKPEIIKKAIDDIFFSKVATYKDLGKDKESQAIYKEMADYTMKYSLLLIIPGEYPIGYKSEI